MNSPERILEFDVNKQRMTKRKGCDFSHIIAGTVGYLKAKFYFSPSEWDGCRKAASFWYKSDEYAVLLDENDTCTIPEEALTGEMFVVTLTGRRDGYNILTNEVKVKQEVRYNGNG